MAAKRREPGLPQRPAILCFGGVSWFCEFELNLRQSTEGCQGNLRFRARVGCAGAPVAHAGRCQHATLPAVQPGCCLPSQGAFPRHSRPPGPSLCMAGGPIRGYCITATLWLSGHFLANAPPNALWLSLCVPCFSSCLLVAIDGRRNSCFQVTFRLSALYLYLQGAHKGVRGTAPGG